MSSGKEGPLAYCGCESTVVSECTELVMRVALGTYVNIGTMLLGVVVEKSCKGPTQFDVRCHPLKLAHFFLLP